MSGGLFLFLIVVLCALVDSVGQDIEEIEKINNATRTDSSADADGCQEVEP